MVVVENAKMAKDDHLILVDELWEITAQKMKLMKARMQGEYHSPRDGMATV